MDLQMQYHHLYANFQKVQTDLEASTVTIKAYECRNKELALKGLKYKRMYLQLQSHVGSLTLADQTPLESKVKYSSMVSIRPVAHELSVSDNKWKFQKDMKEEFESNPPGRVWWVNTNTKFQTSLLDKCYNTHDNPPPGLSVFAPIVSTAELDDAVRDLSRLYQEEDSNRTLPHYNLAPYNRLHIMFTSKNPDDPQMTYSDVMTVLEKRTPLVSSLVSKFSEAIKTLLRIPQETLEKEANIGVIKYNPNAGFHSHIDNMVRSGGSVGPVFTMSLGGSHVKHMDMFPTIEHWIKPQRISTPIGSIILLDGISRMEWAHGIPEMDPTERWTIMIKFRQISDIKVKYSRKLDMDIFESLLYPGNQRGDAKCVRGSHLTTSNQQHKGFRHRRVRNQHGVATSN